MKTFKLLGLFLIICLFNLKYNISHSKKMINVNGKYFKCKSYKNSFERTRGIRTRTCIFSDEDMREIKKLRNENKKRD